MPGPLRPPLATPPHGRARPGLASMTPARLAEVRAKGLAKRRGKRDPFAAARSVATFLANRAAGPFPMATDLWPAPGDVLDGLELATPHDILVALVLAPTAPPAASCSLPSSTAPNAAE